MSMGIVNFYLLIAHGVSLSDLTDRGSLVVDALVGDSRGISQSVCDVDWLIMRVVDRNSMGDTRMCMGNYMGAIPIAVVAILLFFMYISGSILNPAFYNSLEEVIFTSLLRYLHAFP